MITHSPKIEIFFEGKPEYLIQDGKFTDHFLKKKKLGMDEFFSELRMYNVEHIGQVKDALLETNGTLSVLFREESQVKPGLPIWPDQYADDVQVMHPEEYYSCNQCGYTFLGKEKNESCCANHSKKWVKSLSSKRIS